MPSVSDSSWSLLLILKLFFQCRLPRLQMKIQTILLILHPSKLMPRSFAENVTRNFRLGRSLDCCTARHMVLIDFFVLLVLSIIKTKLLQSVAAKKVCTNLRHVYGLVWHNSHFNVIGSHSAGSHIRESFTGTRGPSIWSIFASGFKFWIYTFL